MLKKKQLGLGVYKRINDHYLTLVAAGVAFFAFLSVFPAIATSISLYGLVADANTAQDNVDTITGFIPAEVKELLFTRMQDVATEQNSALTLGLIVGILVSLWSANKAMKAVTIVTSMVSILVIVIAFFYPL